MSGLLGRLKSALAASPRLRALVVFASLFAAYHANFSVLLEGDTLPTETLAFSLLADGRLSFDPIRFPELFDWKTHAPLVESDAFPIGYWDQIIGDRPASEWRRSGHVELAGPKYFLVESTSFQDRGEHVYVSVFGPVPGLLLLPLSASVYAVTHDSHPDLALRIALGKLMASILVAATGAMIFAVLERHTRLTLALFGAAAYGLGSCAFAVSSQNLWQQTVNQCLLMTSAYFALQGGPRRDAMIWSGAFAGAAVACRITSAFALVSVFAWALSRDRRAALAFLLAALPVPALVAVYNAHYFGSPFTFAQELVGKAIALQKTGSPDLFQTPFLTGALGLLFSPSRGLAVYSPVLLPALWGIVRAFRDPASSDLRPFALAAACMMATQCKWFDWWGGHTYGYRPWLDAIPYLALLTLPVLPQLFTSRARRIASMTALGWSIFTQGLGALSYDRSWNTRELHLVELPGSTRPSTFYGYVAAQRAAREKKGSYIGHLRCDIDKAYCRYRLWSLRDSPLVYHTTHFAETRARRLRDTQGEAARNR